MVASSAARSPIPASLKLPVKLTAGHGNDSDATLSRYILGVSATLQCTRSHNEAVPFALTLPPGAERRICGMVKPRTSKPLHRRPVRRTAAVALPPAVVI